MYKLNTLVTILLVFFFNQFNQTRFKISETKPKYNILFIGNSLTYTNDLPSLVKNEAKQKGIKVNVEMVAFPNYAIEDHWNEGIVQKLIASKKYDFVIIQQGPSSQDDGRKMLVEYGKKYSTLCELNNAKLCYFMVWPAVNYYQSFENVIQNYRDAATMNKSILLPVGEIWKEYIDRTNSFEYFSADAFHPSLEGSKIASKVIVEYLFPVQKE
ncbi:SGNH/GDSL hydrolase family protein [Flavobacterium jejuense]|uniref:SGNH/GDSL hydrolase family protein n=1 Tax=Flavobacterium jejuense TaxID=1544455 RepID=A0ABX0IM93_9FLAO|nr:SGNH/GDSL hydrolase family protein [Flavobacterium jejuense]NHN24833.1 SGNH/GDSL hydrolase family protein [Flavobacterium jejuense]